MKLRKCMAAWGLVALISCGGEADGGAPADEIGPLAVVFTADFPDVYGPIRVTIEGHEAIDMEHDSSYSCDAPAAVIDSGEVSFEALSEMHFFWKDEVRREKGQTCLVISLDASTLRTGVVYFTEKDFRKECFPKTITVWVEGRESPLTGSIHHSGVLIPTEPPFTPGAEERRVFQAAREGKAFTLGAGPSPFAPYHFEILDPCGSRGTGGGETPDEDGSMGHGTEVSR